MKETTQMLNTYSKNELVRILKACFNMSELVELCDFLNIEWEDLGGETKAEKAVELAKYCERRDLLAQLDRDVRSLRPEVCPEARVRPHESAPHQMDEPATTANWRLMAVLSSVNLVRIGKAIARMQIEQIKLCQLIEAEIQDLPEQKRAQVERIIESNCEHCKRERAMIEVLAEDGAEDWREFIRDNCTVEEYRSYMNRMAAASRRLDTGSQGSQEEQSEP